MKVLSRVFFILTCAVTLSACTIFDGGNGRADIKVMTRNVYVGGNVDRVLEAQDPNDVPLLVLLTWQEVVANDFNVRARALADEIKSARPHLIGLQEITTLYTQDPGDFLEFDGTQVSPNPTGGTPATTIAYDFLEILQEALEDRGLDYVVAGTIEHTDVEMPMVVNEMPPAFWDVRMVDYDVVLARADVTIQNVTTKTYDTILQVPSLGLDVKRGYIAVDAVVDGESFQFVNTHLEPATEQVPEALQQAQAYELLQSVGNTTTVIVGDLNTGPGDGTYQMFESALFSDAWNKAKRSDPGLTCCYASDLRPGRELETRYDLVFFRNGEGANLTVRSASRHGTDTIDGVGIYPSDHAGVSVGFEAN